MIKVGFLHTIIRPEEKMLLKAFSDRSDVQLEMIDVRNLVFRLGRDQFDLDVVVERCINHSRALHALVMFEAAGIPCVNTAQVAAICGDKLQTSVALHCHNVPQPRVNVAFTEESAMKALEDRFGRQGEVDHLDGVSIDRWEADGWWLNVRASNTEPIIRVIAETSSQETATATCDEAVQRVKEAVGGG